MSAPNDGYGQYPPQQQPYSDQPQDGYDAQGAQAAQPAVADQGKKKKRGYATQAYEFGAGANSNTAGAPTQGQQYGMPQPQAAAYGGYPAQDAQPAAAAYGSPQPQQYGMPQPPAAQPGGYGAYAAPDAGYPASGLAPAAPGVGGLNQQMAGMNLGGQQTQQQPPPGQAARPVALNQLYPTDLMNQPFNVSELDLPPPPIILPPNVRHHSCP